MKYLYVEGPLESGKSVTIHETEDMNVCLVPGRFMIAAQSEDGEEPEAIAEPPAPYPTMPHLPFPEIEVEQLKAWSPFIALTLAECGAGVVVNREHISMVTTAPERPFRTRIFLQNYGPIEVGESPDEVEKLLFGEDKDLAEVDERGEGDAGRAEE